MYPDFLCIGAQKSGTTWLYHNLKMHPGVWLPPVKELHYFDDPSPAKLAARLFSTQRKYKRLRYRLMAQFVRCLKPGADHHLWWHLRFFFLSRTDAWYASLFSPGADQIAGEITPAYAPLEAEAVARIHTLMPQAKIIYLLRNPIDRMWSQMAMYYSKRGRRLETVSDETIKEKVVSSKHLKNSYYSKNLRRWEACYPAQQMYVGFFDQLVEDPAGLLKDILQFLHLDAADHLIPGQVEKKRSARTYRPMPDRIAYDLTALFLEELEQLHQRFANVYTACWLEQARQTLNRGRPVAARLPGLSQ